MDIEAKCSCGASVKINPASGGYMSGSSYGIETKYREERDATSSAFEKWVQAHQGCWQRSMGANMPAEWWQRQAMRVDPAPFPDGTVVSGS